VVLIKNIKASTKAAVKMHTQNNQKEEKYLESKKTGNVK